jgi:hypothetical protein
MAGIISSIFGDEKLILFNKFSMNNPNSDLLEKYCMASFLNPVKKLDL